MNIYKQKNEAGTLPQTIHNSKWIKELNVKAKTIKFLEEIIGVNLQDLGIGNGFLNITSKAQARKEKIDKLNFIKI